MLTATDTDVSRLVTAEAEAQAAWENVRLTDKRRFAKGDERAAYDKREAWYCTMHTQIQLARAAAESGKLTNVAAFVLGQTTDTTPPPPTKPHAEPSEVDQFAIIEAMQNAPRPALEQVVAEMPGTWGAGMATLFIQAMRNAALAASRAAASPEPPPAPSQPTAPLTQAAAEARAAAEWDNNRTTFNASTKERYISSRVGELTGQLKIFTGASNVVVTSR